MLYLRMSVEILEWVKSIELESILMLVYRISYFTVYTYQGKTLCSVVALQWFALIAFLYLLHVAKTLG